MFFSGLTVLLGLLGLVLFEFMILRSVGIAGAIVVGLAVSAALTLLPAILAILGTRIDRLACDPCVPATARPTAPWARLARRVMRAPGRGPRPDAVAAARPRAAVPPRPVQRPGRVDPPRLPSPPARRTTSSPASSARASSRRWSSRSGRRATRRARRTSRSSTTTRAGWPPTRACRRVELARRRRPAAHARPVPAALRRRLGGPPDRFVATALGATTKGDLTAFTVYTPFGPNRDEGRALVRELRDPGEPARAAGGRLGARRWRRRRRRRRRRRASGRTSRGPPRSSS